MAVPLPGILGELKVLKATSRVPRVSSHPAYTSFLVILATRLLMTLTSSKARDLCAQEYSPSLPPRTQHSTKQHLQGGLDFFPAGVF